jgi:hypothetical protein
VATDNFWSRFRRWRRRRPFWGGLFLMLSALELLYSANMNLGALEIHIGPQGFLSYLLPGVLLLAGVLVWVSPAQRLFYGIIGLLTALYSFIGLNLGGFFLGMLFGIIGGALAIAWGPPRLRPGAELTDLPPDAEPVDDTETDTDPYDRTDEHAEEWADDTPALDDTQSIEVAGHDDRPHEEPLRPAGQDAGVVPGFEEEAPAPGAGNRLGRHPKALVLALVPLAVTASILVAGSRTPASADDCPEGLPSRSTAASSSAAAQKAAAAGAKSTTAAPKPKAKTVTPETATPKAAKPKTGAAKKAAATASPSPDEKDRSGNVIVDGIHNLVDGVGNLLGLGDDESPAPSTSPTPSDSATAEPTATVAPAASTPTTGAEPTETPEPAATTAPAATTRPATAQPSASSDDIPCLGARVLGKVAGADDIPLVSAKAGVVKTDSLTMYNSTYDGVVDLPTASGATIEVLKFSMSKAVNKPFTLTVDEPGGGQTVIKSKELVTDKNVKFYTSEFKGKLFGLIPVTFTPKSPPPLTLPVLWFTDATIQLNFIRCDTLTGDPLTITEVG